MTSSTNPQVGYLYDGHNTRVQRSEGGQTSYTMYSKAGRLMHKLAGGMATDYLYAGSLLVAKQQGTSLHYLHTDLLGSPIDGKVGSTSYSEDYRPWGEKLDHPIELAGDIGYTGHQDDLATGLTYMQARYYDPVVGRFMAVDPRAFSAESPISFGRYTYAFDNPQKYLDPDGEWGIPGAIYGAISGAIGGAITAAAGGGSALDVLKGVGAGAIAGGAVGFVMPAASTKAGMIASAAVTGYTSSIAGQAAGNAINGNPADANISQAAALGSAAGGAATTIVARTVGSFMPTAGGGQVVGRAVEAGTANVSRWVGNTVTATIEGAGAGVGEAIASEVFPSSPEEEIEQVVQ